MKKEIILAVLKNIYDRGSYVVYNFYWDSVNVAQIIEQKIIKKTFTFKIDGIKNDKVFNTYKEVEKEVIEILKVKLQKDTFYKRVFKNDFDDRKNLKLIK